MNTDADFWTPAGWERGPMPDDMLRAIDAGAKLEWSAALESCGYYKLATYGNTDDYITLTSLTLYRHTASQSIFVEIWGGDYGLCEFFIGPLFCAAFIVDKLPVLVRGYGLEDDAALVGELKLLRKAFAAFVRHEHGTHVIDEEGQETLEERQAEDERWRLRKLRAEEAKKAALTTGAVQ